jgi:hypothetical protein
VVLCVIVTPFRLVAACRVSGITLGLQFQAFSVLKKEAKRLHPKRVKIHGVGSPSSVVSIVAVLLTAKTRSHGFILSRVKRLFSKNSCPTLGPSLSYNQSVPRVHSPKIKRPGQAAGPGYEVKNERSYTSTFTTCLTEYT